MDEFWWSIEVFDGAELSADRWREAYGAALVEAAISHGVQDWNWHRTNWGIVFEVAFDQPDRWIVFRALPGVIAALDATPDPVNGVRIYPGRGGGSSSRMPRHPRPITGAGAAPIPGSPEPAYTWPQPDTRLLVA